MSGDDRNLTLSAIRVRQSQPETARYDIGFLLLGYDMAQQRIGELESVLREAYKYYPTGNIRDWMGEVLGIKVAAEEEDE